MNETSQLQNLSQNLSQLQCSPKGCAVDVIQYQQQHPGAAYAAEVAKLAATTSISTLKEVLDGYDLLPMPGAMAFKALGMALGFFFPQQGGLPTNPCTYATTDWGKCVWQEIKPFVQFFVQQQLNQAFDTFWTARIQGYQSRLWAMNSSAYQDSEHFPNGSVKDMSNATQTKMYDTLFRIYQDMIGDIPLFMANYSINTTAGAYLSQFASLHSSIMVNLMGSLKYRDQGDRFNFQTITACYAMNVYARATESHKARMAAFSAQSTSTVKCCSLQGQCTQCTGEAYGDSWQQCGWQTGYSVSCYQYLDACQTIPTGSNTEDITAPLESLLCYRQHKSYVEAQTVAYWLTWLAPIPSWLQSIVMMQQVNVTRAQTTLQTGFDCTAFR